MPDRYGFNELVGQVACIDCDERGPASEWPARRRAAHQAEHVKAAAAERERKARQQARDARRLKAMKDRENEIAYGSGHDA